MYYLQAAQQRQEEREHIDSYIARGMRIQEWYLDIGEQGPKQIYVCSEKVDKKVIASGKGTTKSES